MWYGPGWMMGAHFLWWIFWLVILVVVIAIFLRRRPDAGAGPERPTALDILERRYAAGEISTEEFEERKMRLTHTSR